MNEGSKYTEPSMADKAAILMMGIGENAAGEVIRRMAPDKIMALSRAMERVSIVRREDLAKVSEEMLINCDATDMIAASDYVSRTLSQALGHDKASSLMKPTSLDSNPVLEHLLWLDSGDILAMIRHEKPQLQAIVLACLAPEKGSAVLSMLPENIRLDLANRLARLSTIPVASLDMVTDLISNFEHTGSDAQAMHGPNLLAEMLNHMDDKLGNTLLDSIRNQDSELGSEIDELRISFEHLLQMDGHNLSILLEAMSQNVLALALKGTSEAQMERVMAGMSKRAAGYLKDELLNMGAVRASLIHDARHQIVVQARVMVDEGKIALSSNDEMVS